MNSYRFSDILGDDYKLLKHAYPHHDEFQTMVANTLSKHFYKKNLSQINIIEGGCGSGVTTSFLLATNDTIRVTAVDNEAKMIAQAHELIDDISRVKLVESDLLEFIEAQSDGSFDGFVSVWTLHNLEPDYRNKLFPSIYRILKSDGIFISGDKYAVDNQEEHEAQLESQLDMFRSFADLGHPELADAWVKHNIEDDQIRMGELEQKQILTEIGFKQVTTNYRHQMEAIISGVK